MSNEIPPEQLLTRILNVAKLLSNTKTPSDNEISTNQFAGVVPPIIVGNENSDKNVEKLSEQKPM